MTQHIHTIHNNSDIHTNSIQLAAAAEIQPVIGWTEITEKYLANLDVKPRSKETYRKALKQFAEWRLCKP